MQFTSVLFIIVSGKAVHSICSTVVLEMKSRYSYAKVEEIQV